MEPNALEQIGILYLQNVQLQSLLQRAQVELKKQAEVISGKVKAKKDKDGLKTEGDSSK